MELYQSNLGTAGNREASGFVNSAVMVIWDSQSLISPSQRDRQTDTTENITFPQLPFAGGKYCHHLNLEINKTEIRI